MNDAAAEQAEAVDEADLEEVAAEQAEAVDEADLEGLTCQPRRITKTRI